MVTEKEIEDAILVGDPEWLEVDGVRFLSLFAEAETDATHGAVVLIQLDKTRGVVCSVVTADRDNSSTSREGNGISKSITFCITACTSG